MPFLLIYCKFESPTKFSYQCLPSLPKNHPIPQNQLLPHLLSPPSSNRRRSSRGVLRSGSEFHPPSPSPSPSSSSSEYSSDDDLSDIDDFQEALGHLVCLVGNFVNSLPIQTESLYLPPSLWLAASPTRLMTPLYLCTRRLYRGLFLWKSSDAKA